jgi:hypothetical protein
MLGNLAEAASSEVAKANNGETAEARGAQERRNQAVSLPTFKRQSEEEVCSGTKKPMKPTTMATRKRNLNPAVAEASLGT